MSDHAATGASALALAASDAVLKAAVLLSVSLTVAGLGAYLALAAGDAVGSELLFISLPQLLLFTVFLPLLRWATLIWSAATLETGSEYAPLPQLLRVLSSPVHWLHVALQLVAGLTSIWLVSYSSIVSDYLTLFVPCSSRAVTQPMSILPYATSVVSAVCSYSGWCDASASAKGMELYVLHILSPTEDVATVVPGTCWNLTAWYVYLAVVITTLLSVGRWFFTGENRLLALPQQWARARTGFRSSALSHRSLLTQAAYVVYSSLHDAIRAVLVVLPVFHIAFEASALLFRLGVNSVLLCLASSLATAHRFHLFLGSLNVTRWWLFGVVGGSVYTAAAAVLRWLLFGAYMLSNIPVTLVAALIAYCAPPTLLFSSAVSVPNVCAWVSVSLAAFVIASPFALVLSFAAASLAAWEKTILRVILTRRLSSTELLDLYTGAPVSDGNALFNIRLAALQAVMPRSLAAYMLAHSLQKPSGPATSLGLVSTSTVSTANVVPYVLPPWPCNSHAAIAATAAAAAAAPAPGAPPARTPVVAVGPLPHSAVGAPPPSFSWKSWQSLHEWQARMMRGEFAAYARDAHCQVAPSTQASVWRNFVATVGMVIGRIPMHSIFETAAANVAGTGAAGGMNRVVAEGIAQAHADASVLAATDSSILSLIRDAILAPAPPSEPPYATLRIAPTLTSFSARLVSESSGFTLAPSSAPLSPLSSAALASAASSTLNALNHWPEYVAALLEQGVSPLNSAAQRSLLTAAASSVRELGSTASTLDVTPLLAGMSAAALPIWSQPLSLPHHADCTPLHKATFKLYTACAMAGLVQPLNDPMLQELADSLANALGQPLMGTAPATPARQFVARTPARPSSLRASALSALRATVAATPASTVRVPRAPARPAPHSDLRRRHSRAVFVEGGMSLASTLGGAPSQQPASAASALLAQWALHVLTPAEVAYIIDDASGRAWTKLLSAATGVIDATTVSCSVASVYSALPPVASASASVRELTPVAAAGSSNSAPAVATSAVVTNAPQPVQSGKHLAAPTDASMFATKQPTGLPPAPAPEPPVWKSNCVWLVAQVAELLKPFGQAAVNAAYVLLWAPVSTTLAGMRMQYELYWAPWLSTLRLAVVRQCTPVDPVAETLAFVSTRASVAVDAQMGDAAATGARALGGTTLWDLIGVTRADSSALAAMWQPLLQRSVMAMEGATDAAPATCMPATSYRSYGGALSAGASVLSSASRVGSATSRSLHGDASSEVDAGAVEVEVWPRVYVSARAQRVAVLLALGVAGLPCALLLWYYGVYVLPRNPLPFLWAPLRLLAAGISRALSLVLSAALITWLLSCFLASRESYVFNITLMDGDDASVVLQLADAAWLQAGMNADSVCGRMKRDVTLSLPQRFRLACTQSATAFARVLIASCQAGLWCGVALANLCAFGAVSAVRTALFVPYWTLVVRMLPRAALYAVRFTLHALLDVTKWCWVTGMINARRAVAFLTCRRAAQPDDVFPVANAWGWFRAHTLSLQACVRPPAAETASLLFDSRAVISAAHMLLDVCCWCANTQRFPQVVENSIPTIIASLSACLAAVTLQQVSPRSLCAWRYTDEGASGPGDMRSHFLAAGAWNDTSAEEAHVQVLAAIGAAAAARSPEVLMSSLRATRVRTTLGLALGAEEGVVCDALPCARPASVTLQTGLIHALQALHACFPAHYEQLAHHMPSAHMAAVALAVIAPSATADSRGMGASYATASMFARSA